MYKLFLSIILFLAIIAPPAFSQKLTSVVLEFKREYKKGKNTEASEGSIYFQVEGEVFLNIHKPVNQWMIFEENNLFIYYPDEERAFHIISENPIVMPFFRSFICLLKEDFGLPDMGYSLLNHKVEGDALFTYWKPPDELSKVYGEVVLGMKRNKIIFFKTKDPDGNTLTLTTYKNHINYGLFHFPTDIVTIKYMPSGNSTRNVTYQNVKFNVEIPDEIKSFKIPDSITKEKIQW